MKIFTFPKRTAKWIWTHKIRSILIAALLVVAGIIVRSVTKPPQMTTVKAARQPISEVIEASGRIKARETASMTFPAGSKVVWIGVEKGDQVRKGQALASVDRRSLEKAAKKKMLDYMVTRWNFEQVDDDKHIDGRTLSQVTLSDAEKRIVEKSQFGLDQAVLDYEIANLAVSEATLFSPVSGTVTDTGNLVTGQIVSAADLTGQPIKVTNLNSLYFQAEVDEADYGKVKPGMKAAIQLDSFPDATVSGIVSYIGKEGVKKTGGGVQIYVDVDLDPTSVALIPELTGDVKLVVTEQASALVIDKKFVTAKDGSYTVQVMSNKKLETKPVEVGIVTSKAMEITKGLQEGDEVVLIAK